MLWRIRTSLADRPGALAELAARCGADEINILSLEVFTTEAGAVDELVVSTDAGWTADLLTALAAAAGCASTTVTACQADVLSDAPTRYLRSVLRLLDDPCSVDDELERLQGLNEYTAAEWARADVLVEIAGRLAELLSPSDQPAVAAVRPGDGVPVLRDGVVADADAVVAMHERCSQESRAQRYHVPMARLSRRTARHLCAPSGGASVLACVGDAVVGMATVAPWEELGDDGLSVMEAAVLVEDGWQGRGLGTALVRRTVAAARAAGADRVVWVVEHGNTAMLRTVAATRLRARVSSSGDHLTVSVGLNGRGEQDVEHGIPEAVPYGLTRGVEPGTAARPDGLPAVEHAFAGPGAGPAGADRVGAADADGADRRDRP